MQLVYDAVEELAAEATTPGSVKIPAPTKPEELSAHYDLTISHPEVDAVTYAEFERWLALEAKALGLSCALIHDGSASARSIWPIVGRRADHRLFISTYHALSGTVPTISTLV